MRRVDSVAARRVMRASALALLAGAGAHCASAGAPPGGAERHVPPQIVSISPDSGQTNVKIKSVEIKFDEVVSDRPSGSGANLDQLFLLSPRDGSANVSWHRDRITVKPRKGFRENTTYRITMLPGLADLRGNVRTEGATVLFSTGATFPISGIFGRVFDWGAQTPVRGAYIEAMALSDTSLVYLAATDSAGQFDVGPLNPGTYLVRALIDQNANRTIDRNEKWDSTTVAVTNIRPSVELDVIERDSTPPAFANVTVEDSVTLRLEFDKPLDPSLPLQPALIRVQRADSTEVEVVRVRWAAAADRAKTVADSIKAAAAADSARPPAARPAPTPPAARPDTRAAPPPPKPKALPPEKQIVVNVAPASALKPGRYIVIARGLRNLVGNASEIRRGFTVTPPAAPRDSTARPPADSTRRPPPPARPPR